MLASALIALKKRCPFLWRWIEWGNAYLFRMRYPSIRKTAAEVLKNYDDKHFRFSILESSDLEMLAAFLAKQSDETLKYFHPHGFDEPTLKRLCRNKAFVMMKVAEKANGMMVGYFFLRCFFIGRAFHGLIVDREVSGRGIGTAMWRLSSIICRKEHLRMFATISSDNLASYTSCKHGTKAQEVGHLADNYLLIECKDIDE